MTTNTKKKPNTIVFRHEPDNSNSLALRKTLLQRGSDVLWFLPNIIAYCRRERMIKNSGHLHALHGALIPEWGTLLKTEPGCCFLSSRPLTSRFVLRICQKQTRDMTRVCQK